MAAGTTQIEPGVTKTFDDVKDDVKDKLATAKAQLLVQERRDEIEDARNAGKTLKEIADTMKLTHKQVDAADSRGLMPDGKPALPTTDLRKIMAEVFSPDTGLDQEGIDLPDNTYAWVNTISTEPPKQKTFDEVKDEVKARYMSNERNRLISGWSLGTVVIEEQVECAEEEGAGAGGGVEDACVGEVVVEGGGRVVEDVGDEVGWGVVCAGHV